MESIMRNFFLFLAGNRILTKVAKNYGMKLGANRFVAGATINEALTTIQRLNDQGFSVTIDHLGEFIDNEQEAREMAQQCMHAIKGFSQNRLDAQLSLKVTSMGIDISRELCIENLRQILDVANTNDVLITLDAEDEKHATRMLDIFQQLKSEYNNIGAVIQAYLYRTVDDLQMLDSYNSNLRIVKGAYKESPTVAFPDKQDVDLNFKNLIQIHLLRGHYTAIATHDDDIIQFTKAFVEKHNIPKSQFEFQMLYGIRPERQKEIVDEGYKMRIYVPYGEDWYGYNMRRLAERPANVGFVVKGIFKR